jgi:hypothetical protein
VAVQATDLGRRRSTVAQGRLRRRHD